VEAGTEIGPMTDQRVDFLMETISALSSSHPRNTYGKPMSNEQSRNPIAESAFPPKGNGDLCPGAGSARDELKRSVLSRHFRLRPEHLYGVPVLASPSQRFCLARQRHHSASRRCSISIGFVDKPKMTISGPF
jgi:hypothetical protein